MTSGQAPEVTVINRAKQFCLPGSLPVLLWHQHKREMEEYSAESLVFRKLLTICFKANSL